MTVFHTSSSVETKKLGEKFARKILKEKLGRTARVVALEGNLGAGKTTFMQGFLRGAGIRKKTASPTFILMRRFALRKKNFKNIYHLDAYRIKKPRELLSLGLGEIIADPENLVLIEWAERIKSILPRGTKQITFSHGRKEDERRICIK